MIGTDIIDKRRIAQSYSRYGRRFAEKILHPDELLQLDNQKDANRYLAMRWAAKEAFAKALGTGLRDPVLMVNIKITHDDFGAPVFAYTEEITHIMQRQGFRHIHLSLSDEQNYALAFAMAERA